MDPKDRRLGMDAPIARRDFLNGMAWAGLGVAAASFGCSLDDSPTNPAEVPYPPGLTGLRGSTDRAYAAAPPGPHGLHPTWPAPRDIGERYDLVVVGAGISGLAAASLFRDTVGPGAKILVLDNHDDFGGHARRNEFTVDGRLLVGYGGTQSIEDPGSYSEDARGLLQTLGIDVRKFDTAFDQKFEDRHELVTGYFFDQATFGEDRLVRPKSAERWRQLSQRFPLEPPVRIALTRLHERQVDYLGRGTVAEKQRLLLTTSYADYLTHYVKLPAGAIRFLQTATHDLYGVGIDAVPAADCRSLGLPGFDGLKLDDGPLNGQGRSSWREAAEPYIYHFPDGNASIARLLVRRLIPAALPGSTMEDVVTAKADYGELDRAGRAVRLRLNSMATRVTERDDRVEVTYVRDGVTEKVSGAVVILACWNGVIPYLCPEMSPKQRQALAYGVKVPLLYSNVAVRNWTAFAKAKVSRIECPGAYWFACSLDYPVSLGAYRFSSDPTEPTIITMQRTPCRPGLSARDQHRAGRAELLGTPFADYERQLRSQLAAMLGPFGFDPARDIAGITVNRWSHGYSYEYNSLWDPIWNPGEAPNEIGRERFGRIAIANADAAAFAYTDAAIDQGYRAAREVVQLLGNRHSG